MPQQITRNTFEGGINQDTTKAAIKSNQYLEARNLSINEDGKFFGLQNIKGTTHLSNIIASTNTEVIAVFGNKYKIGSSEDNPCLTIFTINTSSKLFKILAYDPINDDLYELFQETRPSTYYAGGIEETINGIGYAEGGLDILYFTDNKEEIRKLRCEIPASYSANFLTAFDLSLQKYGAIGSIAASTTTGGGLLCGSYQVAYQLAVPSKNKYTRWSTLSIPYKIVASEGSTSTIGYGGVGSLSTRKLRVNISPSEDELANYTHFRIGVIENIYPTVAEGSLQAYALPLELISDYLVSTTITNYDLKTNASKVTGSTQIPITDLTVDLLALQTVKTLTIKYNKLLAGNITYKNLEYDNGDPTVGSGSILFEAGSAASSPYIAGDSMSTKVGHFRGEVYRYAISYFDGFGNFSSPKVLDLNLLTENQISGSSPDFKYPDRSTKIGSTYYTLFNSSNKLQGLGLQLTSIDNHPTWAKGFIILRARRKKNILWQSPFIPMMRVEGVGVAGGYPTSARETLPAATVAYDSAQPMGQNAVYIPKNFFWPGGKQITRLSQTSADTGVDLRLPGTESHLVLTPDSSNSFTSVFPQQFMYGDIENTYTYDSSHKLQTVDACKIKVYASRFDSSSTAAGKTIDTEISGTFFAVDKDSYYYDPAHGGAKTALRSSNFTLDGYSEFDNYSEGGSLNGEDILKYSNLETDGITWGKTPNVQKCAVVDAKLSGSGYTRLNSAGSLTFADSGSFATVNDLDETFIYTNNSIHSTFVDTLEIVNCITGLGDDRYGSVTDQHEYLYTGTKVVFTNSELSTVETGSSLPKTVDVWGGDCITTFHTFKISDSTYSVVNQDKYDGTPAGRTDTQLIGEWGRTFLLTGGTASVTIPVAVNGAAQYLQVALESEYNGDIMDFSTLANLTTSNSTSINGTKTARGVRVPLSYRYNLNYSKQNTDKIFLPVDPNINVITESKARLIYTDTKVYQSNIEGFDTFRVLNFYDLDETFGEITKLSQAGNEVYAIQENAVLYIPLGSKIIEALNTDELAVRSSEYINQPVYISTRRGGQNMAAIVENGNQIFIPDVKNRAVYRLSGQQLEQISDLGMSTFFRGTFSSAYTTNMRGFYDLNKEEYWLFNRGTDFCQTFNNKFNIWVSDIGFGAGTSRLHDAVYLDGKVYVVGQDGRAASPYSDSICAYTMYTGDTNDLLGVASDPYIKFVVNEQYENPKTFDDLVFNTTDRLANCIVTVERENALGTQTATTSSLDLSPREGNYRIKVLRDSSNARLRGLYALVEAHWDDTGTPIATTLNSVLTKYRVSQRTP